MSAPPQNMKVQMNVHVPWDFREFLKAKAKSERVSLNQLVNDALMKSYGNEFVAKQSPSPR